MPYNIDFKETKIFAASDILKQRILIDAVEIKSRPDAVNKRNDSSRLHTTWKPIVR